MLMRVLCGSTLLHVCSNYFTGSYVALLYCMFAAIIYFTESDVALLFCMFAAIIIHWGLMWLYFCMSAVIVILCYSTDCMCMCMYRNKSWGWPVESRLCYRLVQYRTRAYFY